MSITHTFRLVFSQIDGHFIVRLLLLFAVISNAMVVIYGVHSIRMGHVSLAALYQEEMDQLDQHGQLLIEKSALTSPRRLEGQAADLFDMHIPESKNIEVWL